MTESPTKKRLLSSIRTVKTDDKPAKAAAQPKTPPAEKRAPARKAAATPKRAPAKPAPAKPSSAPEPAADYGGRRVWPD